MYRVRLPCDGSAQRVTLTPDRTTPLGTEVDAPPGARYALLITRR
ncbi:hypothetical protein [Streptantibioticus silvisoli]|uniref:Uncharacterized protein n=1 Tax=Streptantibioticus silvisoli TaxID=2705255 RepID=A0ABT6W474_9ACTN|nr:hypothetical protein [Streptantibioticus silvisoli]MDI5965170.1 hypothetical protein [Streptantibioticus silvisoli]